MAKIAITGNTYPVKDKLKELGARWDGVDRVWRVDADKAQVARDIVANQPRGAERPSKRPHHLKCHECGRPSKGYYRCYDCSLEYRDGGSRAHGGMSYTDKHGRFVLGDDD